MSSDTAFAGKVAVVTGASSGIGRAMATGLAKAGASVVLVSRDATALAGVAAAPAGRRTSSRPTSPPRTRRRASSAAPWSGSAASTCW